MPALAVFVRSLLFGDRADKLVKLISTGFDNIYCSFSSFDVSDCRNECNLKCLNGDSGFEAH